MPARTVGTIFPAAHVIGTDLSPIQPPWIPTNVEFIVDDIEDPEWLLGDNFDFIHVRHVITFLRDPERLLATCLECVSCRFACTGCSCLSRPSGLQVCTLT